MGNRPAFAATVGSEVKNIPATANTARDGTGTTTTILTAGASGTKVERLKFKARGTTTAGMIRVWIHDGTTFFLHEEIPVTAVTPSATVEAWEAELPLGDDFHETFPTGWTLKAAPHNAESFDVYTDAGDF